MIEGLGAMPDKTELGGTEIVQPIVAKRKFSVWVRHMPSGLGFLITRYSIKFYLIRWILGIGFIPAEVVWERNQKSQPKNSLEEGQSVIT